MEDIESDNATLLRALEARALALRDEANALRTAAKDGEHFAEAERIFELAAEAYSQLPESARAIRGQVLSRMGIGDILRVRLEPSDAAQVQSVLDHYNRWDSVLLRLRASSLVF